MARFFPRGFVHLSGLISFNELHWEAVKDTVLALAPHAERVCQRLAQYARSDIRGEINRTMAEDLALTCSVVFAGRTTVLRLLLGERVSRVRECRVSRGRASRGRRRLVFRLLVGPADRTSVAPCTRCC